MSTLTGDEMMSLAEALWPLNRSLSGSGVRETLKVLRRENPALEVKRFPSGLKRGDWTLPNEWEVRSAYIITPAGKKICNFDENNLHLVGYSESVDMEMDLENLRPHLHTLPSQPDAIPYVTSYYDAKWGFCMTENEARNLEPGRYTVKIDSSKFSGGLDYGELVLPGKSSAEIVFSTYICHPSMANNEISGPVLASAIAKTMSTSSNHYTYRFLFLPETIGAISYISENIASLKKNVRAGFILTCMGDERSYSYIPSRLGQSVADRLGLNVAERLGISLVSYSWLDRGSDERQYCWPGVDLPFASFIRTKYGTNDYPEYHTSLDRLGTVVTRRGLEGSLYFYLELLRQVEVMRFPKSETLGEPQLGRRGRYRNTSIKTHFSRNEILDVLSFCDGQTEASKLPELTGYTTKTVLDALSWAEQEGLVNI